MGCKRACLFFSFWSFSALSWQTCFRAVRLNCFVLCFCLECFFCDLLLIRLFFSFRIPSSDFACRRPFLSLRSAVPVARWCVCDQFLKASMKVEVPPVKAAPEVVEAGPRRKVRFSKRYQSTSGKGAPPQVRKCQPGPPSAPPPVLEEEIVDANPPWHVRERTLITAIGESLEEFDGTTEGVDEETVSTILAGKKEIDAMAAFDIFDVREELSIGAKIITMRWKKVPMGDRWRCRFVAREFRHVDPDMGGLYTSGSTASTSRLVDMHAVQHGYSILCLDAANAYFRAEEDEEVYCWPPKGWVERYPARGGLVENPWWELMRKLHGRRKAPKKFNDFVVTATVALGLEQCPEHPPLFQRPGTRLIFELHREDFYVSGSNVELAWLQGHLGPRLKRKPAEPLGPRSQYSYLRATRTKVDADTVHIAPREALNQERLGHLSSR